MMAALGRIAPASGIAAMQAVECGDPEPTVPHCLLRSGACSASCWLAPALLGWPVAARSPSMRALRSISVGVIGVTMVFNVPMNDALAAVDPSSGEGAAVLGQLSRRTGRAWNHVRARIGHRLHARRSSWPCAEPVWPSDGSRRDKRGRFSLNGGNRPAIGCSRTGRLRRRGRQARMLAARKSFGDPRCTEPNPNIKHPIPMHHARRLPEGAGDAPNIEIGDFTYYDDPDGPDRFAEKCVLHHYPFIGDKLIIGKFCAIAEGRALHHERRQPCDVRLLDLSVQHFRPWLGSRASIPQTWQREMRGDTVSAMMSGSAWKR